MAQFLTFADSSVPTNPVYWVAAFKQFGSLQDNVAGPGVTITYAFKESGNSPNGAWTARTLTPADKDQILDAMNKISQIANVTFVLGDATAELQFAATNAAAGAVGETFSVGPGGTKVEVWARDLAPNTVADNAYIYKHEILHGLGLDHSSAVFGGAPPNIPDSEDNGTTLFGDWVGGFQNHYQLFDIAALQYLYGPPNLRTGNDTYSLNPAAFNPASAQITWPLLWDGGGFDTLDYSALAVAVNISLVPGELSRIGGAAGGILDGGVFSINYRTVIEAAAGGAASDNLMGNSADNTLTGNAGNDIINGGAGADMMAGGGDNDWYFVDNGGDSIVEAGGQGTADRVFASTHYTLTAGAEIEIFSTTNHAGTDAINLNGNELANAIFGNAGANTLDGRVGVDSLNGFGGDDLYFVDNAGDVVNEAANAGADRVFASVSYTLKAGQEVEKLTTTDNAGAGAINLTGNDLANAIFGNAGANTLDGRGGADSMFGLGGDDFYFVDNANDTVAESGGGGTDRVFTSVSYSLGAGSQIEKFTTMDNAATTALNLTGNEFANIIYGNSGANVLNGGLGNDVLVGLGGADTFAFNTALNAVTNVDQISDFNVVDTIQLENAIFTALTTTGTLTASAFHTGATAADLDDRIIYDSTTGALIYDANGSAGGGATQFATLGAGLGLTNADFVVV